MSDPGSAIRGLMRRAPQLVTVVTANGPEGPRGITVSSFIPVSLDPPLVLVSIMNSARAHAAIAAGAFRVHLLAGDSDRLDIGDTLGDEFGFLDPTGAGQVEGLRGHVTVLAYFALF